MIAEGPPEKRPPHMLLESLMRLSFLAVPAALILGLAACDRAAPVAEQEQAADAPPAKAGEGALIETADGLKAELSYAHAGEPYLDGQFTDPTGGMAQLADFKGKPLLVNLWATWCAPCIKEMPTLDALAAGESGPKVLVVSQDLDGREAVDPFWAKQGFTTLEPYTDSQNSLLTALGGNVQLPTTILYDSQGQEVWRLIGPTEWNDPAVAEMLAEAS